MPRSIPGSKAIALTFTTFFAAAALLVSFRSGESAHALPDGTPTETVLDAIVAAPPAEHLERDRIRAHLAEVREELRARETDGLTPEQRRNRARHLAVLGEYMERGEFPRNLDFPGERVPYFVDDRGVHCAVGYLIHRDGRDDLVERIAATRNNARVPELADDPELVAWLEEAGLSAAEAARIQPQYCGFGGTDPRWCPPPAPARSESTLSRRYTAASVAAGALGGLGVGLTLAGEGGTAPRWAAALGAASGMTGLGLGVLGISDGGDARLVGALNASLGLVSSYFGFRSLLDGPHGGPGRPGFEDEEGGVNGEGSAASAPHITLSPIFSANEGAGRRAGLAVRIRY